MFLINFFSYKLLIFFKKILMTKREMGEVLFLAFHYFGYWLLSILAQFFTNVE